MNKKLVALQKRTLTLIQHSTMRFAELNNILTILNVYFEYARRGRKYNLDMPGVTREIERRIRRLEKFPRFAGKHERGKV